MKRNSKGRPAGAGCTSRTRQAKMYEKGLQMERDRVVRNDVNALDKRAEPVKAEEEVQQAEGEAPVQGVEEEKKEDEEEVPTKKEAPVEVPTEEAPVEEEGPTKEAEKTTEKVFGPSTKQKEAEQKEPKEVPASIPCSKGAQQQHACGLSSSSSSSSTSSSSSDGQNPAPPKKPTLVKREDVKTEGSAALGKRAVLTESPSWRMQGHQKWVKKEAGQLWL